MPSHRGDQGRDWYSHLINSSVGALLVDSSESSKDNIFGAGRAVVRANTAPKRSVVTEVKMITAVTTGVMFHTWALEALGRALEELAAGPLTKPATRIDRSSRTLTPRDGDAPVYVIGIGGKSSAIPDYRRITGPTASGRYPVYGNSDLMSARGLHQLHDYFSAMVISLMETGMDLFAGGNIERMSPMVQRFMPLLLHEEQTRRRYADDPRFPFTSGLTNFVFGNEERMRGQASTFSQLLLHFGEMITDDLLRNDANTRSIRDVQRRQLDPTPLEVAAGYSEALVEAALQVPRDLGVRHRRVKGIRPDARQYAEAELRQAGAQPQCPFGSVSGTRYRVSHLTSVNDQGLSGCSGFDPHPAGTDRGRRHLGLYSEFLRLADMLPAGAPDLERISSIHALNAKRVLKDLPFFGRVGGRERSLGSATISDDAQLRDGLTRYIESHGIEPVSVTPSHRDECRNSLQ
jgi:hypothetical protein